MTNKEIWDVVIKEMQSRISRTNFVMWLKNTCVLEKNGDTITIGVDNAFKRTWVEDKYQKDILGIIRTVDPTIKYVIIKVGSEIAASEQKVALAPQRGSVEVSAANPMQLEFKVDSASGLNGRYTLGSFVVGQSNELAHAAGSAIIDSIGNKYNPFFLYGGVGLGKTHLIQAIGNAIKTKYTNVVPQYVTSEKFTSDVVWALRNNRIQDIKNKYRNVDVLIIDDIQFIGGKEKTEEEFFHTFNALYEQNKQIIISSDRPPYALPTLHERLKSRFEGGLIADISLPDIETRMAIIKNKLTERNQYMSDEVVHVIAQKIKKNVREIEGVLTKLMFYQERKQREVTKEIAEEYIEKAIRSMTKPVTESQILTAVSEFYSVTAGDLFGRSRRKEVVEPRQIAMYLLRDILDLSYPYIGEKLGRDHTTAIHSYEKINHELDRNASLNQKIFQIKELLSKTPST